MSVAGDNLGRLSMSDTKKEQLLLLCEKFISDNGISCPETVHQCDSVIVNAYQFIEDICEIVGYQKVDENE